MIDKVLDKIKATLSASSVDYERIVDDFGQVKAYEERKSGKTFTIREHIKGLIYAQLSNQRPWGAIAGSLTKIDAIFRDYDPVILKDEDPKRLVSSVTAIRCGNRRISAQMDALRLNIGTFQEIIGRYGSIDTFITSDTPDAIASELGKESHYKLKEIGFTLAMEYLRNVGINAIKPDVHLCRVIGPKRLGFTAKPPTSEEAYACLMELEKKSKHSAVYLDNLLWIFAAKDYGNICSANPKCHECQVSYYALHPGSSKGADR